MVDVDPGARAVVGDDRRHGLAGGLQVLGADVRRDRAPGPGPHVEEVAEEGVRGRGDQLLRKAGRLGHQVEVEGDGGVDAVHRVPHVQRRQDIEAEQVGDVVRVVEPGPERDQRAAVVPGQSEPVVAESRGQRDDIGGHRALRVRRTAVGRLVAGAVAAQVGADHRVVAGQVGRDVPPDQVGLREAVQQHDRAARCRLPRR